LALAALLKISASRFRRVLLRLKERETLSRFLPAPALERVEKDPTSLEMGGEEQMATILFADIRGFTAISSHLTPKQIVGMLNEYFEEMVDEIFAWEGVMDKFIGDGICAVFVPPLAPRQQALNALQCALGMRRRLAALNARREDRGEAPLEIGIGIHSGALLAGYIGSSKRMEYTHIGDSVNVASRIEGLTKDLGAPILASQASATLCGRSAIFRLRPLRRAKVKGKLRALKVYAVEEVKAKVKQTYGPTRRFHKNLENMD